MAATSSTIIPLSINSTLSIQRSALYGVLLRIKQISGNALDIPQGSLYPALYRLEHQGLIGSKWRYRRGAQRHAHRHGVADGPLHVWPVPPGTLLERREPRRTDAVADGAGDRNVRELLG